MQSRGNQNQYLIKRIRKAGAKFYRGRWVTDPTETQEEEIYASVQELSRVSIGRRGSNKLLKELEGDRATKMIKMYAPFQSFQEADDDLRIQADLIVWEGRTYQVSAVNHWRSAQALDHDEVYAKRMDNDVSRHNT